MVIIIATVKYSKKKEISAQRDPSFPGLCQVCVREAHFLMIAEITNHLFPFWYKKR